VEENVIPLQIESREVIEFVDITSTVQQAISQAGLKDGQVSIFVPHTTAGITINEHADPTVVQDMIRDLQHMVPDRQPYYRHAEGNSPAHVMTSLVGSSLTIPMEHGRMLLGTWQGIFLCEFDGPRRRRIIVQLLAARPDQPAP
jgi:secondary thiamine-phosphate synthase enzyme